MKISTKQFVEIVGVCSVVLSLLVVAYQIQQANDIARVTTEIELRASYAGINELFIENPELRDVFANLDDPNRTFTEEEASLFGSMTYRFLNVWVGMEVAYDEGMIGYESWSETLGNIRNMLENQTAGHQFWKATLSTGEYNPSRVVVQTAKMYLESD